MFSNTLELPVKSPFVLFFFTISFFLGSISKADTNFCPSQVIVTIECLDDGSAFQLIKHLGKYTNPKMEMSSDNQRLVCSFGVNQWVSKYKVKVGNQNRMESATSTQQLLQVANFIDKKDFNFVKMNGNPDPFAVVTYKQKSQNFEQDQMFLFSGLESTFGKDNFNVSANGEVMSTVIVNDRFLKSQNAAADTYVTGSNCIVSIK